MKVALNSNNEWIVLPKYSQDGMYMDEEHKANLDMAKKVIKKDWDMIGVYDGYEGSGKSVKCMQDAFYCDPTLTLDRVVFNPEDFKSAVLSAKKFQAVVYDEAYGGLNSRSAMGQVNKSINQMLTVIRERNLFVFIVLPTFFDLDKYVALWRSRFLVNVYTEQNFKRGFFRFYNKDRKKIMYVGGKKYYDYNQGKHNYSGRFTNFYVLDEEEYRKKKRETSITLDEGKNHIGNIAREIKQHIAINLKDGQLGLSQVKIAKILDITTMTLHNYLNKYDVDGDLLRK